MIHNRRSDKYQRRTIRSDPPDRSTFRWDIYNSHSPFIKLILVHIYGLRSLHMLMFCGAFEEPRQIVIYFPDPKKIGSTTEFGTIIGFPCLHRCDPIGAPLSSYHHYHRCICTIFSLANNIFIIFPFISAVKREFSVLRLSLWLGLGICGTGGVPINNLL